MKKLAASVIALALLALPLFSEANNNSKNTITKTGVFQVKTAEIFYTDSGVYVIFSFFESGDIYDLVIPVAMLQITVDRGIKGTYLKAIYTKNETMWGPMAKPLSAVIQVSGEDVRSEWLRKINAVSSAYRELKNRDVIPTIKK